MTVRVMLLRRSDHLEVSQQQAQGEECASYDGGGV